MSRLNIKKTTGDRYLQAAAFVLPALIPLALFWIIPIFLSIGISFTDWDYMTPEFHFTGLSNYAALFSSETFWQALRQTLIFTAGTVIPAVTIGLLLAVLVRGAGKGQWYSVILFSPWVTPAVAVSIVWTWIYEPDAGIANQILAWLGAQPLPWLHSSRTAMAAVVIVTVWKNIGYVMLFFAGALARIPEEYYDAAAVDGAGGIRRFFSITVPLLAPATFLVNVMMTIEALRAYDQIQILTQGGPSGSTRTLLYLYYQLGFEQFDMGQASAAAVVLLVIGASLAWVQSRIGRKGRA